MRIAVVVPVLHDDAALGQLAEDLAAQSRTPDEVIVVSGAQDEAVGASARRSGFRLIHTRAMRGLQLDTGARATDADLLWFVHADARLPAEACAGVAAAVESGASGGCLGFRFQGPRSLTKRLIEQLVAWRIALGGMAYGDQALFCTREFYERSGGFAHTPLFEEVPVVRHLQRLRSFVQLRTPVYVSCRRWERDGWLRRCMHNRWLALRHMLGAAPDSLARAYGQRASSVADTVTMQRMDAGGRHTWQTLPGAGKPTDASRPAQERTQ